jgi:hypothetical protein
MKRAISFLQEFASAFSPPSPMKKQEEKETHQIFQESVNVIINLNSDPPVGSSAVTSPITAIIPTNSKSINNSKDWTSSAPEARQRMPL